jgi:PIN domain nuclease of toxin-antitoxin system
MRLLLDSHAVLWAASFPDELNPRCRELLVDGANTVYVSSVSIWELRLKESIGKLRLTADFESVLASLRFLELPVNWAHALRSARLPPLHQDPFDRMLVAQSLVEDLVLVTRDRKIQRYDCALLRA